ncbi:unnamed protein product [Phytomonas sp. EM1]|nr:unnamed protein product [Phytomonas sp. EM1]|eukprot:CCW63939.1 unnamed protein product [Phytomonas sp. isolate EM1]
MSKKLTLEQNLYTVELQLPPIRPRARKLEKTSQMDQESSSVEDAEEYVVAVATLLTEDGRYYNPTNIAACQLLYVRPGKLYAYETFDC